MKAMRSPLSISDMPHENSVLRFSLYAGRFNGTVRFSISPTSIFTTVSLDFSKS